MKKVTNFQKSWFNLILIKVLASMKVANNRSSTAIKMKSDYHKNQTLATILIQIRSHGKQTIFLQSVFFSVEEDDLSYIPETWKFTYIKENGVILRPEMCHTAFGKNFTMVGNVIQYTNGKVPICSTQIW